MRVSRFHTGQALAAGEESQLGERASHHIVRVLKLRRGDRVVLFNGDGFDYAGQISAIEGRRVLVAVDARLPAVAEAPVSVTLAQAISRGERMDQTLQKATELGVAAVQPLFTERVEVRLRGVRLEKRMRHWRSVIQAACEQCGRARLPELQSPASLLAWLEQTFEGPRLLLDPRAEIPLSHRVTGATELQLLVGPEGGLSEGEFRSASARGVEPVRLGPRILRTETAGPAALAVVHAVAGEF